jgi:hypothetical protein
LEFEASILTNGGAENVASTRIEPKSQFHIAQSIAGAGLRNLDNISKTARFIRIRSPFTILEVFTRIPMPEESLHRLLMDRAIMCFG